MTDKELFELLKGTGLPVAYSHFKGTSEDPVPAPPYIVYLLSDTTNIICDDEVYMSFDTYQIELYTLKKDTVSEKKVEESLKGHPWEKMSEAYIPSEGMFQVVYEI